MASQLQEKRPQLQPSTKDWNVHENEVWLEASMLPGYNKADSCGYGTASQKLESQDRRRSQKGNSQKTVSTSGSGSQSSGNRSAGHQPSRSSASNDDSWSSGGGGSENGSSGETGSGENGSSHEEPTAQEDRDMKNEKRQVQKALRNTKVPPLTLDEKTPDSVEEETEESESTVFASIFQNGPAYSAGSAEHPKNCMPCVHYCFSKRRGCNRGDDCSFCHGFHESRLQQKRQRWKCNKKPPGKGDASMKIEGGLVLKQALLEETGLETLPVPKVAYGDVKINGGQILPPQLAYVLHPTGHLADPMTIKVPYGLQLGPAPGVRTFGNKVVPPPPGLEEFDNGPESTYVYG